MDRTTSAVEGLLLVDKPAGPTSHDALDRIRRALGQRRAGHCGTLDPFATGLLLVCLGRATRLARYLSGGDKLYEGVIRLGLRTDTDDVTGAPLEEPVAVPPLSPGVLEAAAHDLTGPSLQSPPAFSARKVGGVPAYRRARRGQPVQLLSSPVVVHSFEVGPARDGRVPFRALVSPGTYVRALARDFGMRLGTGACLESLHRLASGPHSVEAGVRLDAQAEDLRRGVIGLNLMLPDLPEVPLDGEAARRFLQGQAVEIAHGTTLWPARAEAVHAGTYPEAATAAPGGPVGTVHAAPPIVGSEPAVRVTASARLVGIGRLGAGPLLRPEVVLGPA